LGLQFVIEIRVASTNFNPEKVFDIVATFVVYIENSMRIYTCFQCFQWL
jgi:hypothetical protein